MSWDQYNQTPASNDLANYFQTSMPPSKVKNAGWDIMADLAQFMSLPTSGGTANAQTVTNTRQFGALFTGMRQSFIPGNTNTGAVTLAIDGLTAKNVFANGVAAIAGMLVAGTVAHVQYDGTQWQLLNPQRSTGSFTLTVSTTYLTIQKTWTISYAIGMDGKTAYVRNATSTTGTSNSTSMIGTGVPAILTPTTTTSGAHRPQYIGIDNNTGFINSIDIGQSSSGQWVFFGNSTLLTGGFTASSVKGINAFETSFTLD